jgi:hypothetical protein
MKALAARPTVLLAYRDREHDVRYLELTPLAALVIERLAAGDPLGQAVTQACAEQGVALDKDVLDAIALVLSELAERGVLLGAEQG